MSSSTTPGGNNSDDKHQQHNNNGTTPSGTTDSATNTTVMGSATNPPPSSSQSHFQSQVRAGGAPARVYMNEKIVPYLLEGMKAVTRDQPPNPLRVLGEFLIQKSNEVESGATSTSTSTKVSD
ncbi:hypothetical protein VTN96DRAFT_1039 [Rasamsonia emersonii]